MTRTQGRGGRSPGGLGASDGLHRGRGGERGVPGRGLEAGLEFLARAGSARVHGPFLLRESSGREPSTADPRPPDRPRGFRGLCGPGIWDLAELRPAHPSR